MKLWLRCLLLTVVLLLTAIKKKKKNYHHVSHAWLVTSPIVCTTRRVVVAPPQQHYSQLQASQQQQQQQQQEEEEDTVVVTTATSETNDSSSSSSSTTNTTLTIPSGQGLYKPFADWIWNEWQNTGWFDAVSTGSSSSSDDNVVIENVAPAKGFPPGSVVRMTVQYAVARPDAPVAYARFALLETLVPVADSNDDKTPPLPQQQQQHQGIQVLNAVVIPRHNKNDSAQNLPVWGADFVALPGNKHLLLLDAQPMVANDTTYEYWDEWYYNTNGGVPTAWPWAGGLPPAVQPYVSPRALWTRLGPSSGGGGGGGNTTTNSDAATTTAEPTIKIATDLLPTMQAHWKVYQQYVDDSGDDAPSNTTVSSSTNKNGAQNCLRPYLEYRLSKDPARPMLQALYGKEWTENILETVLFPMQLIFGDEGKVDDQEEEEESE